MMIVNNCLQNNRGFIVVFFNCLKASAYEGYESILGTRSCSTAFNIFFIDMRFCQQTPNARHVLNVPRRQKLIDIGKNPFIINKMELFSISLCKFFMHSRDKYFGVLKERRALAALFKITGQYRNTHSCTGSYTGENPAYQALVFMDKATISGSLPVQPKIYPAENIPSVKTADDADQIGLGLVQKFFLGHARNIANHNRPVYAQKAWAA